MAQLTDQDYGAARDHIYRPGQGKEELKALPNLPNKAQLKAIFQVFEDVWTNNAAAAKVAIEAILGRTITVALLRKFGLAWLVLKVSKGG